MMSGLRRYFRSRASGLTLVVVLLAVWQAASLHHLVDPIFIPPPTTILQAGIRQVQNGALPQALLGTVRRFAIGYALATLVGSTLGLLLGSWRPVYALLEPAVEMLRPLPSPAIVPVFILLLGIEDRMKIAVVVFAASFPIIVNTMHGVRSIDPVLIDTARTFGYRGLGIIRRIVVPAAMPAMAAGMRISLAVSLIVTVVAEMLAGSSGMGFYILDNQRTFAIPEMYAGIVVLALLGYSLNWLFVALERWALRWHLEPR
jgi:ABC-type nitrate/sulfonate/bicarbonate transport system permease component